MIGAGSPRFAAIPEHTPAAAAAIQTDHFIDGLAEVIVRYVEVE